MVLTETEEAEELSWQMDGLRRFILSGNCDRLIAPDEKRLEGEEDKPMGSCITT
ncbi:hypothetical protein LCGC14_1897990 [marine sediment metagenome]|uniref:Uncharacterized protein n=1 Tax=marine sediment metagenome TaxID=412755 RepID=A0A0F9FXQ1_9ZZZZ